MDRQFVGGSHRSFRRFAFILGAAVPAALFFFGMPGISQEIMASEDNNRLTPIENSFLQNPLVSDEELAARCEATPTLMICQGFEAQQQEIIEQQEVSNEQFEAASEEILNLLEVARFNQDYPLIKELAIEYFELNAAVGGRIAEENSAIIWVADVEYVLGNYQAAIDWYDWLLERERGLDGYALVTVMNDRVRALERLYVQNPNEVAIFGNLCRSMRTAIQMNTEFRNSNIGAPYRPQITERLMNLSSSQHLWCNSAAITEERLDETAWLTDEDRRFILEAIEAQKQMRGESLNRFEFSTED